MPGGRKTGRIRLLAALSAAFAWVGLGPFLLAYAAASAVASVYAYFLLWAAGLFSDFYTTYRFYRADPEGFEGNELSGYMRRLYRVFGFSAGLAAFLAFVEVPVGLIVSLALVPASANVFGVAEPGALVCLASGFAFLGIGHLAAAAWNGALEWKEPPKEPLP